MADSNEDTTDSGPAQGPVSAEQQPAIMPVEERMRAALGIARLCGDPAAVFAEVARIWGDEHAAAAVEAERERAEKEAVDADAEDLAMWERGSWREVWTHMGQSDECGNGSREQVMAYIADVKADEARHDEMRQDVLAARRERDEERARAEKAERERDELSGLWGAAEAIIEEVTGERDEARALLSHMCPQMKHEWSSQAPVYLAFLPQWWVDRRAALLGAEPGEADRG